MSCLWEGCEDKVDVRGLCRPHYQQVIKRLGKLAPLDRLNEERRMEEAGEWLAKQLNNRNWRQQRAVEIMFQNRGPERCVNSDRQPRGD